MVLSQIETLRLTASVVSPRIAAQAEYQATDAVFSWSYSVKYSIKAHPTFYSGVAFRSRLEARWACFFDMVHWEWQYEPVDLYGWSPDFMVKFPCGHSECNGCHRLFIEVKPFYDIRDFNGHPCLDYFYGGRIENGEVVDEIPADASAAFGIDPSLTYWQMCHGIGGGIYSVSDWVCNAQLIWKAAGNVVQWHPRRTWNGLKA